MKKNYTLLLACFLGVFSSEAATLVVNNSNPSPGQYTTVTAAMTAASNGDILLIQPSLTSYGTVTVNKSVTLRGGGWNPAFKQVTYETTFGDINLSASLSNVKLEGLTFNSLGLLATSGIYGQSNILIEFCKINQVVNFYRNCHDWIIRNNYFALDGSDNITTGSNGSSTSNLIIEHNIFRGYLSYLYEVSNVLISHNLFITASTNTTRYAFSQTTSGLLVSNNIFSQVLPVSNIGTAAMTNCSFSNNIYTRASGSVTLPSGNGVTVTQIDNPTNKVLEFETYDNTGFNVNHNYRLKATSLGKGTGTDTKDVGIYTDLNTFSMTGEPEIPAVRTLLILNSVIPSGGTLNINMTGSKSRRDKN